MSTDADARPKSSGRLVGARRKRRARLIIAAGAAFILSVALAGYALRDAINLFMLPSDFDERFAAGEIEPGDTLRIGGFVAEGSVSEAEGAAIRFVITDSVKEVPVIFAGVLPDLFREKQGVVADGKWEGDRAGGVFRATKVLAKHDENYDPPQLEDALRERGLTPEAAAAGASAQ